MGESVRSKPAKGILIFCVRNILWMRKRHRMARARWIKEEEEELLYRHVAVSAYYQWDSLKSLRNECFHVVLVRRLSFINSFPMHCHGVGWYLTFANTNAIVCFGFYIITENRTQTYTHIAQNSFVYHFAAFSNHPTETSQQPDISMLTSEVKQKDGDV